MARPQAEPGRQGAPRSVANAARAILQQEPDNLTAKLHLASALLQLGQGAAALTTLPAVPENLWHETLLARARLMALRQQGAALWANGSFAEAQSHYAGLHALEETTRTLYQPQLQADPANQHLWDVLVDAVGNYRLQQALTQALPEPAVLEQAYYALVTGGTTPMTAHRQVMAARLHSIGHWPHDEDVVAQFPTPPRFYQPSTFGTESAALLPALLPPRQAIRLREALAYNAGDYLFVRAASGAAPWLQEGMWGNHLSQHLPFVLPQPFSLLEGAGLGTVVTTLPPATAQVETPVAVLGYWNNYGHTLHDVLPQLADAEAVLGRDCHILACASLLPALRAAFAMMGYGEERLITVAAQQSVTVREAYCFSPRTVLQRLRRFTPALPPENRHYDVALDDTGLDFVRERLLLRAESYKPPEAAAAKPTHKIFLARRGTARQLENEAAVEALLAAQGYRILQPETLPFAEQIALFRGASHVVALEGASLANLLFMPAGGQVLVLRSLAWGWSVNCFTELARHGRLHLENLDFAGRSVPLAALAAHAFFAAA